MRVLHFAITEDAPYTSELEGLAVERNFIAKMVSPRACYKYTPSPRNDGTWYSHGEIPHDYIGPELVREIERQWAIAGIG